LGPLDGHADQLVKQLQDWCQRAEASGVDELQTFSWMLRSYALSPGAVFPTIDGALASAPTVARDPSAIFWQ
jgi:hypothetical protein